MSFQLHDVIITLVKDMTPQEKLEQYSKEIAEDLKLNEMVIQQKSFEIPQRKHYWVTKLILETQELNRLERKKKALEKLPLKSRSHWFKCLLLL